MRSLIGILLFAMAASVLAGDTNTDFKTDQTRVAGQTATQPEAKVPFFLYSTKPAMAVNISDRFKQDQARIAGLIEAWPVSKTRFFFYSLDPGSSTKYNVNTDQIFHGFRILGKSDIKHEDDAAALLKAFAQGIREDEGLVAFCFNPRHGLRMVVGSSTNDFVICFECGSVQTYGFGNERGFLVTSSPDAAFNHLVDKYHLKKPKRDT